MRCSRCRSRESSIAAHDEDHGEAGCALQSMEVHCGADIHLQPVEGTPCRSRWMPEGDCDPHGEPTLSRLLSGPADLWREEPMLEQVCWQGS